MKLTRSRELVVNMGNYESLRIGASVDIEVADESSTQLLGQSVSDIAFKDACAKADDLLDQALATDLQEAQKLTYVKDSFSLSWREAKTNA